MRRKLLTITFVFIFGIIVWNLGVAKGEKNIIDSSNRYDDNKSVINNSNALTLMLETEVGSGEYALSNSGEWPGDGYIFNFELSKCENGGELSWDTNTNRVIMQSNSSDRCYVYFDKEPERVNFADYIISGYTTDGANGLYYHDGQGSYTNADQEAGDNSYRYSGADPNNYVCFGSDADNCPIDNLYRIIGVFDGQVKLIKHDYANSDLLGTNGAYSSSTYTYTGSSYYRGTKTTINRYSWNSVTGTNTWSNSDLNEMNLNRNYITNIGSEWSNLIAEHTWIVGGNTTSNINGVAIKNTYINEIISPVANTTYTAKIGLMYISDYGYAASPENWQTTLSNYGNGTNRNNNWMFMGLNEWTITPVSSTWNKEFELGSGGYVTYYASSSSGIYYAVRPVFYLNSTVELFDGGSGTASNPYILSV